jgi:hypothetical protein
MRNKLLFAAAAVCFAATMSVPAEAMPASSPGSIAAIQTSGSGAAAAANLILVRQGCGRGFHRNRRGFCRPNRRWHRRHWRHCHTRWTPYGYRRICR